MSAGKFLKPGVYIKEDYETLIWMGKGNRLTNAYEVKLKELNDLYHKIKNDKENRSRWFRYGRDIGNGSDEIRRTIFSGVKIRRTYNHKEKLHITRKEMKDLMDWYINK